MRNTTHAKQRMQQRALPEMWIFLLHRFGDIREQKGGTMEVYLPRGSRDRLRQELTGVLRQFDHLQDTFLIEDGQTVITAGHKKTG